MESFVWFGLVVGFTGALAIPLGLWLHTHRWVSVARRGGIGAARLHHEDDQDVVRGSYDDCEVAMRRGQGGLELVLRSSATLPHSSRPLRHDGELDALLEAIDLSAPSEASASVALRDVDLIAVAAAFDPEATARISELLGRIAGVEIRVEGLRDEIQAVAVHRELLAETLAAMHALWLLLVQGEQDFGARLRARLAAAGVGAAQRLLMSLLYHLDAADRATRQQLFGIARVSPPRLRRFARALAQGGTSADRRLAISGWVPPGVRVAAMRRLTDDSDDATAEAAVRSGVNSAHTEVRVAALDLLGARGDEAWLDALPPASWRWSYLVQEALCRALAAVGGERARDTLSTHLDLVQHQARLDVCNALAQVGGAEAVQPLMRLARKRGESVELRQSARAALLAVQERLSGEGGALAVVETGEAGALSHAWGGELGEA